YIAFSGPLPWMAVFSMQFFLLIFLFTLAMCFLSPVAEDIIFRGFLLNRSIGWGRYSRAYGIIISSLAFAFMHTLYLFEVTYDNLYVYS
ncbi:CPBP family intramembrane glutamic endopeptidase, partial [Salmonella enterica]|uniref:CPBP family intramembrane glutamic endopeptidase n=1 Tax=Salmonella enterica TaxID=28901 RepID=UPI000B003ADB